MAADVRLELAAPRVPTMVQPYAGFEWVLGPHSALIAELLPRMLAWDGQPFGFLAAYEAGSFVGWFHLRPSVADAGILELGYRLRRAAWGRGLATEGSRALLARTLIDLAVELGFLGGSVALPRDAVKPIPSSATLHPTITEKRVV